MDASEIERLWLDAADQVYAARDDASLRRSDHARWQEKVNAATERANELYEMWAKVRTPEQERAEIDDIVSKVVNN